jgi:tetratricopeptide (TPR) repeat protein
MYYIPNWNKLKVFTMHAKSKILALSLLATVCVASPGPSADPFDDRLIAPSDPLAYYDRSGEGIRLFEAGKYKEAEQALLEATRAYPNDGLIWLYLGMTQGTIRKYSEAVQSYQKAKELHTEVAGWFPDYAMAQAYAPMGDKENAIRALENVTNIFYQFPQQIYDKKMFASLRDDPRFKKLTGQHDLSGLSRNEGWTKDVDLLVEHIRKTNPEIRGRALPAAFLARYEELKRDIPKLTDDQAYAGIMRMVATLHQGHTGVFAMPNSKLPRRIFPLDLYAFPEGVYVISADAKNKDLIGAHLLSVESTPTTKLLQILADYATVESPMEVLTQTMLTMRDLALLRGIGVVAPGKEDIRLTFQAANGNKIERTLATVEPPMSNNNRLVAPPAVQAPMFLRDLGREHWFERLPQHDAMYVQVNHMVDQAGETLPEFGLNLRKALNENPAKHLILDLRHNNGGTTQRYPELLRTVIAHSTKEGNRTYVLISRHVYSACANFVTDLERLAKPTFVGEATSGMGNQHGDSTYFFLPYSGIGCQLSGAIWQLSTPFDFRRSMVPDIPVQLTAKAYFAGADPALEVVLKDTKRPARPDMPELP